MTRAITRHAALSAVFLFLLAACEPENITEARNQIGRGGERSIVFALPLIDTVFKIEELLEDTDIDTTAAGLLAVEIEPESVSVGVGEALEFEDLDFDQFVFGYDQMLQTSEASTSVAVPSPAMIGPARAPAQGPDQIQFSTPDGSTVVGATIDTGTVVRTMNNATNCDATVTVTLTDDMGATIVDFGTTAIATGEVKTDSVDIANVTVGGDVTLNSSATFGGCVPNPGSSVATEVTFRPMTLASVDLENVNESFSESYSLLAGEPGISAVDTVVVASGSFSVTVQNRLPINLSLDITLNGIFDAFGQPLSDNLIVGAAPGNGSYTSGMLTFPLAGVTIVPEDAEAEALGSAVASAATITSTVIEDAVIVDGSGGLEVQSISGELDPAETPELTVSIEEVEEIPEADIDLGDLEEAIEESTINDATISLTIGNTTGVQTVLSDFFLGVVNLDAAGNVPRDVFGDPIYEEDAGGQPILLPVTDPGQSTLTLEASATTNVELDAAALLDRLVHLLLDDERAAIVAAGSVVVGDGTRATVTRSDEVSVEIGMTLGLDFTIPSTGVSFTRNTISDGLQFDPEDADQLVERIDSAGVVTEVVNNTPFGVEVDIAFAEDSLGEDFDVFDLPDAVVLSTILLAAPTVDAQGVVTTPSSTTVSIVLTGAQARELAGDRFTATVRARLLPGSGGGGRGAIRASDEIELDSRARVVLSAGGTQ